MQAGACTVPVNIGTAASMLRQPITGTNLKRSHLAWEARACRRPRGWVCGAAFPRQESTGGLRLRRVWFSKMVIHRITIFRGNLMF